MTQGHPSSRSPSCPFDFKTHELSPVSPGHKVTEKWTPLTPAKEVAGGALVWIGDHIFFGGEVWFSTRYVSVIA